MIFKVKTDNYSVTTENGLLKLKLSSMPNNGLSFDASGNLIATPGTSSGTGIYNFPGNGIGPADIEEHAAGDIDVPLNIVGMNTTVSRHKKYTGNSAFVHNNDGVVMSKLDGTNIATDCVAYFMINHNNGGGE